MTTIGLYFAALAIPDKIPSNVPLVVFYVALVFTFLFILSGAIYIYFIAKLHLNPICFLDDVRCTYRTEEKQLEVIWSFCDYSASNVFYIGCFARFGKQTIFVEPWFLDATRDPKAECINGTRWQVHRLKQNIEVDVPERFLIDIKMKPYGLFWSWTKKSIEVNTSLIKH